MATSQTRGLKKATVTRLITKIETSVATGKRDDITQVLEQLKSAYEEFELIHDELVAENMDDHEQHQKWLQTTQPTSGGAVTVVSSCCANCVEPPRPQQWGPDLPFFGHADPLDGWRCCSQKRVMSRPIQVRQL